MSAAAVSRIIRAEAGAFVRRHLYVLDQADKASTTVFTPNGTRHQAASLSKARRALVRRGFRVDTFHGAAGLPLAPHTYYLTVSGKATKR